LIWRRDANDWFTDKRRAASRLGAEGLVEQPSAETVAGYLGIDADGIFFGTFGVSPLAVQSVTIAPVVNAARGPVRRRDGGRICGGWRGLEITAGSCDRV